MTKEMIAEELRRSIITVLPDLTAAEIDDDERLVDLGANSIDRMEILALTLDALNIPIPLVKLAPIQQIGELVNLLLREHYRA